jgi:polyhydroxybutyrate depolymerase
MQRANVPMSLRVQRERATPARVSVCLAARCTCALIVCALTLSALTWLSAPARALPDEAAPKPAARATSERKPQPTGTPPSRLARKSRGCSKRAQVGSDSFVSHSVTIGERERTYHLHAPKAYRAGRAYPLIFRFHGRGGDGLSGGLGIEEQSRGDALVVAPDGLDRNWSRESEASDMALFDALLQTLSDTYCIDPSRVFAYGFSAGARFAERLACERSDKLRAIAAIAGFDATPLSACRGRVAAWLAHDADDESYASLSRGIVARDRLRAQNGCSAESAPVGSCVRYLGCAAGYPVVWCQTRGRGHDIRGGDAPAQVWKFFTQLARPRP